METENIINQLNTFADFLKLWKNNTIEDDFKDHSHYLKSNPLIDSVLSVGPCFIYMLNYKTMKYEYLSKNVNTLLGYDCNKIKNEGAAFFYSVLHPEDQKELLEKVHVKLLAYYNALPIEDRTKFKCSYDFRIKRMDGTYIRLLQQTIVLEVDSSGNPILDIGIVSDITEYKKYNEIKLTLSKHDQENNFFPLDYSEIKFNDLISDRELEILKLLIKGNSSKKIAEQLGISINTVRNHRQNMMGKTNTKNIAELITYAHSKNLV